MRLKFLNLLRELVRPIGFKTRQRPQEQIEQEGRGVRGPKLQQVRGKGKKETATFIFQANVLARWIFT